MSNAEITPQMSPPAAITAPENFGQHVDACIEWLGDLLNPIVVKEARQALKSRQFTLTFYLLLICGGCWTALGVAFNVPDIFHVPSGPFMVRGYYFILCVPMLLVVPFVAFRSLAAEREDGTFELLAITTLNGRQIVLGKLASAVLQMMVYYSALAPCIAFTYLLKGLDIVTIMLFLAFLWLSSLVLTSIGLALGTITKSRHWQVLLSVIMVAGLMLFLIIWVRMSAEAFDDVLMQPPYEHTDYWMLLIAITTILLSFFCLFLTLAAGQISFSSDNRSTPMRWVLLGQHGLWFGWTIYLLQRLATTGNGSFYEIFVVSTTIATLYWWFIGSFLIGERAELSPRVRRSLPHSLLGRTLLTWLNPGSGTGYVFTFVNMLTFIVALAGVELILLQPIFNMNTNRFATFGGRESLSHSLFYGFTVLGYLSLFLGVGRLMVLLVRSRTPNTVLFSFLLQIVLVAFGTLIPLVVQFSILRDAPQDYTLMQITNPFWTLVELAGSDMGFSTVEQTSYMIVVLGGAMVCLHFYLAALEINQTRVLAPQRVREEDAAIIAAHTAHKRKNPWDEPAVETGEP